MIGAAVPEALSLLIPYRAAPSRVMAWYSSCAAGCLDGLVPLTRYDISPRFRYPLMVPPSTGRRPFHVGVQVRPGVTIRRVGDIAVLTDWTQAAV